MISDGLAQKLHNDLPALHGRLWAVGGAIHVEERVAGSFEGVELMGLVRSAQRHGEIVVLLGRWILVFGAEQSEYLTG